MNLSRALAQIMKSPSKPNYLLPHPLFILQSSLYSSSSSSSSSPPKRTRKPKSHIPIPPPSLPQETDATLPKSGIENGSKKLTDQLPPPLPPARPEPSLSSSSPEQSPLSISSVSKEGEVPQVMDLTKEAGWKKPSAIPWQPKIVNSVNLIGYVGQTVQSKASDDGKFWAGTVLKQDQTPDTQLWIPIIFEGDLAHIAAFHLKEKDLVHVTGELSGDPPQLVMEHGQDTIQVMVRNLNFVEEPHKRKELHPSYMQDEQTLKFSDVAKPRGWLNDGVDKSLATGPNFEGKDYAQLLGINESTSDWKSSDSNLSNSSHQTIRTSQNSDKEAAETFWRDLVDNPTCWSDNRKDKLSGTLKPGYPDFKHKDSGEGLWLNRAPYWVRPKLERLFGVPQTKDDYWKNLVENPDNWWDNRLTKRNVRAPDFRNKTTGEVLWLDTAPAWVRSSFAEKCNEG